MPAKMGSTAFGAPNAVPARLRNGTVKTYLVAISSEQQAEKRAWRPPIHGLFRSTLGKFSEI
jgi:hypothetical protein